MTMITSETIKALGFTMDEFRGGGCTAFVLNINETYEVVITTIDGCSAPDFNDYDCNYIVGFQNKVDCDDTLPAIVTKSAANLEKFINDVQNEWWFNKT